LQRGIVQFSANGGRPGRPRLAPWCRSREIPSTSRRDAPPELGGGLRPQRSITCSGRTSPPTARRGALGERPPPCKRRPRPRMVLESSWADFKGDTGPRSTNVLSRPARRSLRATPRERCRGLSRRCRPRGGGGGPLRPAVFVSVLRREDPRRHHERHGPQMPSASGRGASNEVPMGATRSCAPNRVRHPHAPGSTCPGPSRAITSPSRAFVHPRRVSPAGSRPRPSPMGLSRTFEGRPHGCAPARASKSHAH